MPIDDKSYLQPTEYNLDDYMKEVNGWKTNAPFLGLADAIQPTEDTDYQDRIKRAAKVNALGDVLGALFGSATAASGGVVNKTEPNPWQIKTLSDYNAERARTLADKDRLEAAQLQSRLENIKYGIEEDRSKRNARLAGIKDASDKDFAAREAARGDLAKEKLYEQIYGKKADIARENRTGRTTSGGSNKLYSFAKDGHNYFLNEGQLMDVYNLIYNQMKSGGIPDEEGLMNKIKYAYSPEDIDPELMKVIVSRYFDRPGVYDAFSNYSNQNITASRQIQSASSATPTPTPAGSQPTVTPSNASQNIVAPSNDVTDFSKVNWITPNQNK